MPHAYDTGLAKPQRTLIREAIIAKLAPLLTTAVPASYVASIKSLPRPLRGEGDDDGIAMLIEMARGKAPLIMVAIGRKRYESNVDPLEARGELELAVYAASAHSRDLVDGRLAGDGVSQGSLTADPGIETMLEHIEERLLGQPLGVDGVAELRPVDEDEVATFADVTIWELKFNVMVERVINPNRDATILVDSIQGEHQEDSIADGEPLGPLVTVTDLEAP